MKAFEINASGVGVISSSYWIAYALMQIPAGILMDRFGAKKLLAIASFLCGIGGFVFGFSTSITMAVFGRFLMGIGSAFAFIGMVYITSELFAKAKLAFLIGIGHSISMFGMILGTGPLSCAVDSHLGWRLTSIIAFGAVGFFLAIIILLGAPNDGIKNNSFFSKTIKLFENLKIIASNPKILLLSLIGLLFYLTLDSLGGLWGIPFLQRVYSIDKKTAAFCVSMIFAGLIVGGPIIGKCSDILRKRKLFIKYSSIFSFFLLILIIYFKLSLLLLFSLFFILGFFVSALLLVYTSAVEINSFRLKGVTTATVNLITCVGVAISQFLIGFLLDIFWDGKYLNGIPIYSIKSYRIILTYLPISLLIAFILSSILKEPKIKSS